MRSMLVVWIVIAAARPAHAEDETVAGNVLVWLDARLYLDPDEAAPSVQLGTLDRPRDESLGFVVPMRVIGASAAFVEVEATTGVECAWARADHRDDITSPRLFVRRTDLAPVLAKRFDARLAAGTRITLEAGVAIGRATAGGVAVSLHGQELAAAIPEPSVRLSYPPHAIAAVEEPGPRDRVLDAGEVTLGDQTITLTEAWSARRVQRRGQLVLFPLQARCMTAIVAAPRERVTRSKTLGVGTGVGVGGRVGVGFGRYLPSGTELTSATGTHVVARTAARIDLRGEAAATGTRACIDRRVGLSTPVMDAPRIKRAPQADRTMQLCAPASSVEDDSPRPRP